MNYQPLNPVKYITKMGYTKINTYLCKNKKLAIPEYEMMSKIYKTHDFLHSESTML